MAFVTVYPLMLRRGINNWLLFLYCIFNLAAIAGPAIHRMKKMNNLTDTTKQIFFQLLEGYLSIKDFGQWIYSNNEKLEIELHPDLYHDIISIDYNEEDSFIDVNNLLAPYIDINEVNIWRTKKLLTEIIEQKIDLVLATRKLRELYFATGENFIPITLGIGYESELDDLPIPNEYHQWDSKALEEKLKKIDMYKENLLCDVKKFIATL